MTNAIPIIVKFTGKTTLVKKFIFDPTEYDVLHFTIEWGNHSKKDKYTTVMEDTPTWHKETMNFLIATVAITLYKEKLKDFLVCDEKKEILEDEDGKVMVNPKYALYFDNKKLTELNLDKVIAHYSKDPRSGKVFKFENEVNNEILSQAS